MINSFPTNTRERLFGLLERFRARAQPGPFEADWVHTMDGGKHGTHVVFGAMIHGNEFGSLPAVVRLVEALRDGQLRFGGRVTVFIGNPNAARENQRFLEADLNRVFLPSDQTTHEHRRAQALMPILDTADVFVDFHQTILETRQPFYINPWHTNGWHWARALASAPVWVTRDPRLQFSASARCSDEYVVQRGQTGLTVELSQKGFSEQAERICWRTMCTALECADAIAAGTNGIRNIAIGKPDLHFLTTTHSEAFASPAHHLKPGLVNFQPVVAGETLHRDGTPTLRVPSAGVLLFPKYPPRDKDGALSPRPKDIYRLVTPLSAHPTELWPDPDDG
jgi:succinylglutamate desuccinylase